MTPREKRYSAYIGILIGFLIAVLMTLPGCTIYKVHSEPGKSVDVSVWSTRNFVAPDLVYTRDGEAVGFSFGAESSVQPGPQDYAAGVATGVRAMMMVPATPKPDDQ